MRRRMKIDSGNVTRSELTALQGALLGDLVGVAGATKRRLLAHGMLSETSDGCVLTREGDALLRSAIGRLHEPKHAPTLYPWTVRAMLAGDSGAREEELTGEP